MAETIQLRVNNRPVRVSVEAGRSLLWVLRTELGLTGTKYGCGQNLCGACTVLVGNEPVRSCRVSVGDVRGKNVTTIEGLSRNGKLHPLQQAFLEAGAYQCGFCTPGMILNAHALLLKTPRPGRQEIIDAMEGNLCRCGSYNRIISAIEAASGSVRGGKA